MPPDLIVRHLGRAEYLPTWQAMQAFTDTRDDASPDEFWSVEHPPVYTLGRAGRREHLIAVEDIPVVHVDRGGQVTYHGPGQAVLYTLVDLRRLGIGVRSMVSALETVVIDLLQAYGVPAVTRESAPGVYVDGRKIAALGLRVRRGCCFHGLALNVENDLAAFGGIDPCGYPGLQVTCTRIEGIDAGRDELARDLIGRLASHLGHTAPVEVGAHLETS